MTTRPAQRTVVILYHQCLKVSHIQHPTSWLLRRTKSVRLGRQRDCHTLRKVHTPATRGLDGEKTQDMEVEVAGEVGMADETEGIEGTAGMGKVEQAVVGPTGRKTSGVRNGRMSISLPSESQ